MDQYAALVRGKRSARLALAAAAASEQARMAQEAADARSEMIGTALVRVPPFFVFVWVFLSLQSSHSCRLTLTPPPNFQVLSFLQVCQLVTAPALASMCVAAENHFAGALSPDGRSFKDVYGRCAAMHVALRPKAWLERARVWRLIWTQNASGAWVRATSLRHHHSPCVHNMEADARAVPQATGTPRIASRSRCARARRTRRPPSAATRPPPTPSPSPSPPSAEATTGLPTATAACAAAC